ncbi:MAG: hypothetical protein ACOCUQ_01030 [Bacteroidota bacterium]
MIHYLDFFHEEKDTNAVFQGSKNLLNVNGHIHTPYSFSAFDSVEQAFTMALNEDVKVLGINDFNTFDGYPEFVEMSLKYHIFPLLNVEFMGLLEQEQKKGIRINDPLNPGRIYLSGKGCDFQPSLSAENTRKWNQIREESMIQVKKMVEKTSALLQQIDTALILGFEEVLKNYTRGILRERHIAKAVRLKIFDRFKDPVTRKQKLENLFGGKPLLSSLDDNVSLDNEIRANLLKSGGAAYVKENPKAFLPLKDIIDLIIDAGGIPCYPVLLDDKNGNFTEFEKDPVQLLQSLESRGVFSIELIPVRNDFFALKDFVSFFVEKGFIITFGTEHNTPALDPLTVSTRGKKELDTFLKRVNFEGACLIAYHQYLRSKGEQGITSKDMLDAYRKDLVEKGSTIIHAFLRSKQIF